EAIATMSQLDIGSLVIMDHGQLAGMLTFREIINHLNAHDGQAGDYTVRSIMDDAPVSVTPNTDADEVQRLMLDKHARYIPVMSGAPGCLLSGKPPPYGAGFGSSTWRSHRRGPSSRKRRCLSLMSTGGPPTRGNPRPPCPETTGARARRAPPQASACQARRNT